MTPNSSLNMNKTQLQRRMLLSAGTAGLLSSLSACGMFSRQTRDVSADNRHQVTPFSASPANGEIPAGWTLSKMWLAKTRTEYKTIGDGGTTVVHARSERSASGLFCDLDIAPDMARTLSWRWRTDGLSADANVGIPEKDDAVARLVVSMDGDHSQLGFRDMLFREQALLFAGLDLPYSTLIYVWDPVHPVGTVLTIRETTRIRYLVVESGTQNLGDWQHYKRDLHADMKAAYDEPLGKILNVGITTDSNDTQSIAQAWYGDIRIDAS